MGRSKNIYAVIDVETAGGFKNPLVYDLGIVITDKVGRIYAKKMWLVSDIISNKSIMDTAYYKNKLPLYREMYKKDRSIYHSFEQIKKEFNQLLVDFNVTFITAYNLSFDIRALKSTNLSLSSDENIEWKMCEFITAPYQYIDIWSAACETLCSQNTYKKVATENEWISAAGNYKSSAEIVYRYITKQYDYIESHTALDDCIIETDILIKILQQKQKITRNALVPHPWRMIQEKRE